MVVCLRITRMDTRILECGDLSPLSGREDLSERRRARAVRIPATATSRLPPQSCDKSQHSITDARSLARPRSCALASPEGCAPHELTRRCNILSVLFVSSVVPALKSVAPAVKILRLYISPGHDYFGHHGQPPGGHAAIEVPRIECVAGRGIRGDRFFDFKENYNGQITFFANEVYEALGEHFQVADKDAGVFRRNVITHGVDLNELIGTEFEIQGVRFRGCSECSPCYWMDRAFCTGAEAWLKGRGGLRAQILSDGVIEAGR
jgi:MOSC domain-containing protein